MKELEWIRIRGGEKVLVVNHREQKTFRYRSEYVIIYKQRLRTARERDGLEFEPGHVIL